MKRKAKVLTAALTAAAALSLAAPAASASASASARTESSRQADTAHAVFVQTNGTAGNMIRVFGRAADGSLTSAGEYATGGLGGTEQEAPVDALASQGSLVYANGLLFAVNAGSDTVTVFKVYDGTRLRRIQVIRSGGDFPVSIAVHGGLAYVLNAGGQGALQAYRLSDNRLWPIHGDNRSLHLGNATPPVHISAPAQVLVSPDGRYVLVPTKNHNTVQVFPSYGGWLASAPVTSASANPVPFAGVFDERGDLLLTEAGTSTVTAYHLNPDGTLSVVGSSASDGQAALCWIVGVDGHYYGTNAGSANFSKFEIGPSGVPVAETGAASDAGPIDMAASGDYLYVQNAGAGTVTGYAVNPTDGALRQVTSVTGLPAYDNGGMEGIAAS
ncbi:hypothetical protein ABZ484_06965 [Streptomyces sp. NPDC006393]|uniref:lactonase family protein n=1 Tax=Streptomyces sp. NPDC006393 TaxID=3156763 RepID=UPI0033FC2336